MTDSSSPRDAAGPGLAKARPLPLLQSREALLVRATDGRWKALLQRASILSEGAPRAEGAGSTWFGSTSLLVPLGDLAEHERALVVRVAAHDLHLRLRALRVAREEAALRAPAPLGTTVCVVRICEEAGALRIDVDVEAPMMEARSRMRAPGRRGATVPESDGSPQR